MKKPEFELATLDEVVEPLRILRAALAAADGRDKRPAKPKPNAVAEAK